MKINALKISLNSDLAHSYLINKLQDGNSLAQHLLQQVPFEKGHYVALLHPSADKNKIYDFHSGGILPPNPLEQIPFRGKLYTGRKKENSVLQLAQYLKNIMSPGACCYFEDLLHRKQDPIAKKFKENTLYYHEEPYLFLQSTCFSIERAVEMIHYTDAQWYYMNIVSDEIMKFHLDVREELLQKIAFDTRYIVIGAYDMEGYILWEKRK